MLGKSAIGETESQDLYDRWDARIKEQLLHKTTVTVRNTFGWIVEIDPFKASGQNPVKTYML